jgi:hypothetical protein
MKKDDEFDRMDDYEEKEMGAGCAYAFLVCLVFWAVMYWLFG